jgi:aldose 1-epimerase
MARVRLAAPDGARSVAVRMDRTYSHVMVYTGDTLPDPLRKRRSLAVEPMTAAPNAFQTGEGLQVLEPGQEVTSEWGIEVFPG